MSACNISVKPNSGSSDLSLDPPITQEEANILLSDPTIGTNEKEAIYANELYQHQISNVIMMRKALEYLNEKYPEDDFVIQSLERSSFQPQKDIAFTFTTDRCEKEYKVKYFEEDNCFKDDFYADLMAPEYNRELSEFLKASNFDVVSVDTVFSSFSNGYETENLLFLDSSFTRTTSIYINNNKKHFDSEEIKDIKDCILNKGLCGYFFIYCSSLFEDGMTIEQCQEIVKTNEVMISSVAFGAP